MFQQQHSCHITIFDYDYDYQLPDTENTYLYSAWEMCIKLSAIFDRVLQAFRFSDGLCIHLLYFGGC